LVETSVKQSKVRDVSGCDGGGLEATLREVLKHKTVEKVVMIETDGMMVNVSQ
jgi:spermidine synthase